jgi:long-subunit acyl-CoA synthetase (AMP-forming)
MTTAGAHNSWVKKKIAAWARKKGLAAGYAHQQNLPEPSLVSLADKLVFSKVRKRLGFDRCRLFISTAAPISQDSLEFFLSLGIPVTEVYGMSECSGPATLANVQTIKKFVILPEEFSIEGDELTPTMKLKRRIINQKYATQIEGMYT